MAAAGMVLLFSAVLVWCRNKSQSCSNYNRENHVKVHVHNNHHYHNMQKCMEDTGKYISGFLLPIKLFISYSLLTTICYYWPLTPWSGLKILEESPLDFGHGNHKESQEHTTDTPQNQTKSIIALPSKSRISYSMKKNWAIFLNFKVILIGIFIFTKTNY